MKHYILAATISLFAIACNQGNSSQKEGSMADADTSAYELVSFYKSSTECDKDTCGAYVKATYPVFKDNTLNKFIVNVIAVKPFDSIAHHSLDVAADSFITEYVNFKQEFPETAGGYEWIQNLEVSYEDAKVISFTHSNYGYTGGAHGLENTLYYNLAKPSLTVLSLEDLFINDSKAELTKIAEEIFRRDESLSENDSLSDGYFFEGGIFGLAGNFLITEKGILFTYNPYEIKAYAYGSTDLLIPYNKIEHLINPEGVLATYLK